MPKAYGVPKRLPTPEPSKPAVKASGSTQSSARQIGYGLNVIGTVASGTGVRLSPFIPGVATVVINQGANTLAIYPTRGQKIDTNAVNASVTLAAGSGVVIWGATAKQGYSEAPAGTGGGGGAPTNASYVVISLDATLSDERVLAVGTGLQLTDGGAGGNATLAPANDLAALEAMAANGIVTRTASETYALRTVTAGTDVSVSNGDGVSGNPTISLPSTVATNARCAVSKNSGATVGTRRRHNFIESTGIGLTISDDAGNEEVDITIAPANDLLAVEGISSTGLATRTASETWTVRTITAGTDVSVSNGDGVSGNPTISLPSTVATNARVAVSKNSGATTGTRRRINLIEGSGITLTIADDSGNEEVDITITATGAAALFAYKTADTNRASTTTLTNDPHLSVTVASSTKYRIRCVIHMNNAAAVGGFKLALGGTASITNFAGQIKGFNVSTFGTTSNGPRISGFGSSHQWTASGSVNYFVEIDGYIEINAGGTLLLQTAQSVSDAGNSTYLRGSYLEALPE